MKKLNLIFIVFLSVIMGSSCNKKAADNHSAPEQQTQPGATEELSWVTLLPTTSFDS